MLFQQQNSGGLKRRDVKVTVALQKSLTRFCSEYCFYCIFL